MILAPRFINWLLKRLKKDAITLPPWGIYCVAQCLNDAELAAHEQVHWQQYERMGFWRYYATYLWYQMRYGYANNPMEIEARNHS